MTHGAEVHIDFGGGGGGRGGAEGGVDAFPVLLGSLVCGLDGAAAGGSTSAVSQEHLDISEIHTARFPVVSLLAVRTPPPPPPTAGNAAFSFNHRGEKKRSWRKLVWKTITDGSGAPRDSPTTVSGHDSLTKTNTISLRLHLRTSHRGLLDTSICFTLFAAVGYDCVILLGT